MKNTKDTIAEVMKEGLKHSIAQVFLVFSGILVIISFLNGNEMLIRIGFWTLFYGMIAHYLKSLSKHETLGRYAAGYEHKQVILFSRVYLYFLISWAVGTAVILLIFSNFATSLLEFLLNVNTYLFYLLFLIVFGLLFVPLILMAIWLRRMFKNKSEVEKNLVGNYKMELICKHCGFEFKKDKTNRVTILKKRPIWDQPCPRCGLYELNRVPDKENYKIQVSGCENCGQFSGGVDIPKGLPFKNFPCPNCKVADLRKKQ